MNFLAAPGGILSKCITVATMQEHSGGNHNVAPKNYLVKAGFFDRNEYNQVAKFIRDYYTKL
ncbi:hypothetical protein HD598_001827 [Neomicrococcus aestuarii]|uniref:Uncharacterized protein n=1 Tax=Neomicrococcus aestuarii TaxID=556325 RepID=A0A7W8X092_9MICC|nr:hypothetical protein [Neomicrococcus aestuarii]MBB5513140.1 hypothetical protein [Neomicrococcus aestuarii]